MGCAISKFPTRIVDLSKRANSSTKGSVTINAHNLHTYLNSDNPNPKCIFIFGGTGSNKGEFIWEMLQQSCENYINKDIHDATKFLVNKDSINLNVVKCSYHYIDVEKLIVDNLDKRIKKLTSNVQSSGGFFTNNYADDDNPLVSINNNGLHLAVESPDPFIYRSPKRKKSSSFEELKTQLLLYANIVTNSWILSLIKKEIDDNNYGPYEKIFIINLIPNRITLFKNCLYLKQSPSFVNFNFNYIAINLVKNISKRKDLEIKMAEQYDEINSNFIGYFRLINKLIDIRVENIRSKCCLKLTTTKNAIKVSTRDELVSFIYMPKKNHLELNIFDFKFESYIKTLEMCKKVSLMFVLNNQIDLDDGIVLLLEEKNIDLIHVRKFIQLYRIVQYSLNFN